MSFDFHRFYSEDLAMDCSSTLQKYMVGQELFLEFSFKALMFLRFSVFLNPFPSHSLPEVRYLYLFLKSLLKSKTAFARTKDQKASLPSERVLLS